MALLNINIEGADEETLKKYNEIFAALIRTGGLSGVKNGKTIIHFDHAGTFMGIQFDYWPFRRRKNT